MNDSDVTVQQLFDLAGRTALVTGGGGHLGRAIAAALAEAGARVVVSSRDADRAAQTAKRLPRPAGADHFGLPLDHKQSATLETAWEHLLANTQRLDILVNNGQSGCGNDWTDISDEQFRDHQANASGYFQLARLARDHAVQRQHPLSIIMLGSMYGVVASYPDAYEGVCSASSVAYHALKGGIVQMTRHLAVYWARDNVRVNCLSPGPFPNETAPPEMVARLCGKSPMGRMGTPRELKGAAVFLASDASSYVTGHNLIVDGGWTAW